MAEEQEPPTVISLGPAWQMAVEVHGLQLGKDGESYVFHILRVAQQMHTDVERVVAILHDVLEDCGGTNQANEYYHRILTAYGPEVANAVALLTRMEGEPYMDYIRCLSENPLAVRTKMADLRDNLNPERLAALRPEEADRLRAKYLPAQHFLLTLPEVKQ